MRYIILNVKTDPNLSTAGLFSWLYVLLSVQKGAPLLPNDYLHVLRRIVNENIIACMYHTRTWSPVSQSYGYDGVCHCSS